MDTKTKDILRKLIGILREANTDKQFTSDEYHDHESFDEIDEESFVNLLKEIEEA